MAELEQSADEIDRFKALDEIARMAKLADAADLKSADRKVVGVQVPLRAPTKLKTYKCNGCLLYTSRCV